jgi:two-component system response regulator PilR (NtrC family)
VAHRILIIDDEQDILHSLRDLLLLLPAIEVVSASTFAQGKALASQGGWALILTDQRLPDGHGVDILAEAARADPSTALVLMSAFQDFDAILRGVNAAHIDHFIQKPYDPDDVLRRVEHMLKDRAEGKTMRRPTFRRIGGSQGMAPGQGLRQV